MAPWWKMPKAGVLIKPVEIRWLQGSLRARICCIFLPYGICFTTWCLPRDLPDSRYYRKCLPFLAPHKHAKSTVVLPAGSATCCSPEPRGSCGQCICASESNGDNDLGWWPQILLVIWFLLMKVLCLIIVSIKELMLLHCYSWAYILRIRSSPGWLVCHLGPI